MTVDEIIAAAQAQTGLGDIGDPAILDGLERLLAGYAEEARFTERGAQMAHGDLVNYMAIRMKVEGWLKDHPELLDAPIDVNEAPTARALGHVEGALRFEQVSLTTDRGVKVLDEVSFDAAQRQGQTLTIDAAYVQERLGALSQNEDLSRFIL